MKTTAIVILVVAFLAICVSMASTERAAKVKPVLSDNNTWSYSQDFFDQGLERYTIRIMTQRRVTDQEAQELAAYTKATHDRSNNHIIFFEQPDRMGAYYKITYPEGSVEQMENYER